MMFSLLKCVRLGKLAVCVPKHVQEHVCENVCEHMCSCVLLSPVCIHQCPYMRDTYRTLDRWVLHGCDQ